MKKKKIIILIIILIVLAVLLIPLPERNKDGGTVKYRAVLWSYTKFHALSEKNDETGKRVSGYDVGHEFKILGFTLSEEKHFEKNSDGSDITMVSEITSQPENPETTSEATSEITSEISPEITSEVTPRITSEATPEVTSELTPEPTKVQADNLPKLPSGKTLSTDTLPRVDGALALEPFYDAVFAELLGLSPEDAKLFVMCNNTPSAYKNLTYDKADMIFCAMPSDAQVEEAKAVGVEFEYHTILSGGFVFFVNKENPVDSVTQEQLKGIVSGKITNWKELGGEDEPIVLFQRNEGSGSQTGLYRYVLPMEEVMIPPLDQTESLMSGVVDRVSDYDNGRGAISYSYYYYVANMYTSNEIKLLGIDGVIPSDETISKGEYPFLNFSQIVTRKDLPQDSIVRDIIAWIQGENGARIARENGYVPYDITK